MFPRNNARIQTSETIDLISDNESEKSPGPILVTHPKIPALDRINLTSGTEENTQP